MAQHVNINPAIQVVCLCGYPLSFFFFDSCHSLTHLNMSIFISLSADATGFHRLHFMLFILSLIGPGRGVLSANNFCASSLSDVVVRRC